MAKFFELIKPNHNIEFSGRMNLFLGLSMFLVALSFAMLPINHFWRGHSLNYGIDFRGGTEIQVAFNGPQDPAKIRSSMQAAGFGDTEAVKINDAAFPNTFLLRFGAVSQVSEKQVPAIEAALRAGMGADSLRKFDFSEGGDKLYLRFNKPVEPEKIAQILKDKNVKNNAVQRYGRPEDNAYEVILVGLDVEVRSALEKGLGAGVVGSIPSVESVGAKAASSRSCSRSS